MHDTTDTLIMPDRRTFLRHGLVLTAGAAAFSMSPGVFAAISKEKERVLSFYHIHTREKSKVLYWSNGRYVKDGIAEISELLRDFRSGSIAKIDIELIDSLYALRTKLDSRHHFEVISGYRSPKTNKALRRKDHDGVAKKSYHMKGMAIDVRMPGVELSNLRKAAVSLKAGGVGYYPSSNFLHLDVGRVRQWHGKS